MKIRNGFVSNSSSSSFVIIGVKRSGDYDEIMENENFNDKDISSLYVEASDCDYITGIMIASGDGYDFTESSITFGKIQEYAERVANALKVDINEVELVTGTYPC